MHDVRVALERHELRHAHAAVGTDAPEVVASEVDEHHMFGPLLLVALELLAEPQVFLVRPTAPAGPGDWMGLGMTPLDAHQHLGG